eukprot:gene11384-4551_t
MTIHYGSIIRNDELKADFPTDKIKLRTSIMQNILPKLSPNDFRQTIQQNKVQFHVKKENGICVFCVASEDTKKRVAWNFIQELYDAFVELGDAITKTKVQTIISKGMKKWNDPNSDTINVLNDKITDLQEVLVIQIDKLLLRGEKLEDISRETDQLLQSGEDFSIGAKKVERAAFWKKWMLIFVIIVIILAILMVIGIGVIVLICDFPSFSRCGGSK